MIKNGFYLLMLFISGCTPSSRSNDLLSTEQTFVRTKQEQCQITVEPKYSVDIKSIRESGIVGELAMPAECAASVQNLVLVLGGSEGGIPTYIAKSLAERGLAALALGYFNVTGENLPASIDKIPLEYFQNALSNIQRIIPNSKCCVLLGFSKGAEGALAFASVAKPNLLGVILISGSDTAFEGYSATGNGQSSGNSGWSFGGNQTAFTPYIIPDQALLAKMFPMGYSKPPVLKPFYDATLALSTGYEGILPIEQVMSSILLLSGDDDQVWTSSSMSQKAVQRAKANGFKFSIEHYSFANVGHFVLFGEQLLQADPYNLTRFGGTIEGTKIAAPVAWSKIATFLDKAYSN